MVQLAVVQWVDILVSSPEGQTTQCSERMSYFGRVIRKKLLLSKKSLLYGYILLFRIAKLHMSKPQNFERHLLVKTKHNRLAQTPDANSKV